MRSAGRRHDGGKGLQSGIYLIQQSEEMENELSDFHHVGLTAEGNEETVSEKNSNIKWWMFEREGFGTRK